MFRFITSSLDGVNGFVTALSNRLLLQIQAGQPWNSDEGSCPCPCFRSARSLTAYLCCRPTRSLTAYPCLDLHNLSQPIYAVDLHDLSQPIHAVDLHDLSQPILAVDLYTISHSLSMLWSYKISTASQSPLLQITPASGHNRMGKGHNRCNGQIS